MMMKCVNVGLFVLVTKLFIIIHLAQTQESTFKCPLQGSIEPCTCERSSVTCDHVEITQGRIDSILQELRQVNNISADDWLIFESFRIMGATRLTQLDLSSFLKLRLDHLQIVDCPMLTRITGPPLNLRGARGLIDVEYLYLRKNGLTNQGLGRTLEYFSNRMRLLHLDANQLTEPSSPTTTNSMDQDEFTTTRMDFQNYEKSDIEFLPGFSNLTNLKYLFLSHNKIRRLIGGPFKKNVRLDQLVLSGNPIEEIGQNAFEFLDPPLNALYWLIKIDLNSCNLTQFSFTSNYAGLEKTKLPVLLDLRNNRLTTLPTTPFKVLLNSVEENQLTIDLANNPLMCDQNLRWLVENKTRDFSRVLVSAKCANDVGETVFTSTYVRLDADGICTRLKQNNEPCTCQRHDDIFLTVKCSTIFVTQEKVDNIFVKLKHFNTNLTHQWLTLRSFRFDSTDLEQFDLSPLIRVRLDQLKFSGNIALREIRGPQPTQSNEGLIDVKYLSVTDSVLSMNDFGETLKYFSNNMTHLILDKNKFTQTLAVDADPKGKLFLGHNVLKKKNKLKMLSLAGNQIQKLEEDCFLFDDADGMSREVLTIDLSSNLLTAGSFPAKLGTEGMTRRVRLVLDTNRRLSSLPKIPFEIFLSQGNSISLDGNRLVCDENVKWIRSRKTEFIELVYPFNCINDVGHTVFTTELLATVQEISSMCLQREIIFPCKCQMIKFQKIFLCAGDDVTPANLYQFFQKLTQLYRSFNITHPPTFDTFELTATTFTHIDLLPFYDLNVKTVEISHNQNLTKIIIGPRQLNLSHGELEHLKSIQVTELRIIFNPQLTRHGFGETLKYFSPNHLTQLSLQGNNFGDVPSFTENSSFGEIQLLSGLTALKNLEMISLAENKIRRIRHALQFKNHTKLKFVLLEDNNLNEIDDEFFQFDDDPPNEMLNEVLHIRLSRNDLTENSFQSQTNIGKIKRPVHLVLSQNQLTTLPKIPFEAFLDARPENVLDLQGNPLLCDDRVVWLRQRKADLKSRVNLPDCVNDEGQTIFDSKLVLDDSPSDFSVIILNVLIPSLVIIIIAAIFLYCRYRRTKQQLRDLTAEEVNDFKLGNSTFDPQDPHAPIHSRPFDSTLEIPEHLIEIDKTKILGSGQFGVVYKGILMTMVSRVTVAIKTVKSNVDVETFKALLSEIKIMGHISQHQNIASLHGACTTKIEKREALAVVEFCGNGDLRNYLKGRRQLFHDLFHPTPPSMDQPYENCRRTEGSIETLSTVELLKFSLGVANGMKFLTTKNVIHGDLAARNILLTDDLQVKISDFGLSRQLIEYTNYIKKTRVPLPCKWMSPEAIKDLNFSIKSDVWSFGVVLYEIFTLGEIPYPGLPVNHEFIDRLLAGYRMQCPQHANQQVYDLMLNCWQMEARDRPSFEIVYDQLTMLTTSWTPNN